MSAMMESPYHHQSLIGGAAGGYDGAPATGRRCLSSSLSQPDPPAVDFGASATHLHSSTLPRPPQQLRLHADAATTAAPANARRRLVSSRVSDYLKSLNSMARSIVLEKEYVEERHGGEWRSMNEALQEEVVDDYFMPADVHAHYGTLPRSRGRSYREPRSPSVSPTRDERLSFRNARVMSPDSASVHSSPPQTYFIPPTHNRLHKNQLSYRSKALRKVMNLPAASETTSAHYQQRQQHRQSEKRDSGLGSDGESPRTSDEDRNPLGFHRNHLRSFSLRQKKGNGRGTLSRSSTRRAPPQRSSVSDEVRSSNSSTRSPATVRQQGQEDRGYDAEVDLPDDSLLRDHVTGSAHNQVGSRTPPKPSRYSSRARRSLRMQPRILVDKFTTEDEEEEEEEKENDSVVVIPNSISRVASNSSTSTVASTFNYFDTSVPVYRNQPATVLTNLRRVHSEDSIDTDTESIAQSNVSLLSKSTGILTEDEMLSDATATILTCPTPDSFLPVPPQLGSRPGSKRGRGLVRSRPHSRRGGSFLQTSTSEFANRRAQFKPNMLRNQQFSAQSSPAHTRQSTPAFSRQNTPGVVSPTPDTPTGTHPTSPHLKTPPSSLSGLMQRRGSTTDSIDAPMSPECPLSPPHIPLVKSVSGSSVSHRHLLHVKRESQEEQKRESGYISSSSESFPFSARK